MQSHNYGNKVWTNFFLKQINGNNKLSKYYNLKVKSLIKWANSLNKTKWIENKEDNSQSIINANLPFNQFCQSNIQSTT